ncbi:uncharacterized protein LOC144450833 [Glandiceps talaboti]
MFSRTSVIAILLTVMVCVYSSLAVNICKTKTGRRMKSCKPGSRRLGKRGDESITAVDAIMALLKSAANVVQDMDNEEISQLLEDASSSEEDNTLPQFDIDGADKF